MPSKPTIKVHWNKLPAYAAKNTVWSKLNQGEGVGEQLQLDYNYLEDTFQV